MYLCATAHQYETDHGITLIYHAIAMQYTNFTH